MEKNLLIVSLVSSFLIIFLVGTILATSFFPTNKGCSSTKNIIEITSIIKHKIDSNKKLNDNNIFQDTINVIKGGKSNHYYVEIVESLSPTSS